MKKYQLRRIIREVIERELNNSMFPIRDTQFDRNDEEDDEVNELVVGSDKTLLYNKEMIKNWINFGLENEWIERDSKQITDWVKILGSKNIQLEMERIHFKHNKEDDYDDYNDVSGTLINKKELRQLIDNEYLK
tara:strand:+ start:280 stop:681 length:402 start_codon:yes stop_codon:yes gene_type:complete